MATHGNELTEPVDLCSPDGDRLNPAARGWSRRPLHRANLQGRFGVNRRWDYWAVLAGDVLVSSVYADVDHLGLADLWWADLATGSTGGGVVTVGNDGFDLSERPGTAPLRIDRDGFELTYEDDNAGTRCAGRGPRATAAWVASTCTSPCRPATSRSTS